MLGAFVFLLAALAILWPGAPGIRDVMMYIPAAQLVAFPALGALLLAGFACRRRLCRALAVLGVLALFFPHGAIYPRAERSVVGSAMTLVVFNTQGKLRAENMTRLIEEFDPDVMVLPETRREQAEEAGTEGFQVFTGLAPSPVPTTVLVHSRLGPAHQVEGPETPFGTVGVGFADPDIPTVMGIHAVAPLPRDMARWRADIDELFEYARHAESPLIMAGDFNATLRHGAAASTALVDSARQCSHFAPGTWPRSAPRVLRAQIDHVFASPEIAASACRVEDIGLSDHAAYVVTLSYPTLTPSKVPMP